MKKLFRMSQSPSLPKSRYTGTSDLSYSTGLKPRFTVPPLPHPCPHHRIAILVTPQGLLLRPAISGVSHPVSHVRVRWGKTVEVEELQGDGENADWTEAAVVYGVLGMLKLFSESCILVITAKTDIGNFLDPTYSVYGVKSVAVIPLDESGARTVVNSIFIRNSEVAQGLPSPTAATPGEVYNGPPLQIPTASRSNSQDVVTPAKATSSDPARPKVKFSDSEDVKILSPLAADFQFRSSSPPSPTSSGASTPVSESDTTAPVAKALAARLSFWSRLSKRQPSNSVTSAEEEPLRESLDERIETGVEEPKAVLQDLLDSTAPAPATVEERHSELDDKIVKECVKEFTKGGMYFAYNFDITTSLQHKQHQLAVLKRNISSRPNLKDSVSTSSVEDKTDVLAEPNATLPLWRRVDRQFWWNEWMLQPFIDAGLHSYVLPIMQGFYQISTFHIPREPEVTETGNSALVDYIIVSRRSRDRAGLRYQRRGVDDDANVANFVETETVMRVEREAVLNVFSYVQIRGSIPLFWTQSGYSLKPAPQLESDRTQEQHLHALGRHFKKTIPRYGPHTLVNLAEQHGKEAVVTNAYRECATKLDSADVQYTEYDFHTETKGMKYENISKLIDRMEKTFEAQGFLWVSGASLMSEQKGVFRVNCIDCLDRTNVVQSAFARNVLTKQLGAVALLNPDAERTETDIVFNDVWANNGDAISRAYAGTSALKGDFTRTGKRDLGGMLNDGMNSLARMYTSTFSDWFSQAVIDFMLGYRTLSVFAEFLLKLQSTDPRERIRISKIRAEAIATSVSRVLAEGERLLSGWTLLSPAELNTKVGENFVEKVLLLTVKALYIISYDYHLEKVTKYNRVALGDIVGITKGVYILSPLEEGSRDPMQNQGFMVSYLTSGQTTRVTSYSLRNSADARDLSPDSSSTVAIKSLQAPSRSVSLLSRILSNANAEGSNDTAFAAFKAMPVDPARARRGAGNSGFEEQGDDLSGATSCKEAVEVMVDAIRRACEDVGAGQGVFVTEADIVNLAQAQRMTTVYAKMEYGLKRLLWLGG